jgi:hypothetical protein
MTNCEQSGAAEARPTAGSDETHERRAVDELVAARQSTWIERKMDEGMTREEAEEAEAEENRQFIERLIADGNWEAVKVAREVTAELGALTPEEGERRERRPVKLLPVLSEAEFNRRIAEINYVPPEVAARNAAVQRQIAAFEAQDEARQSARLFFLSPLAWAIRKGMRG